MPSLAASSRILRQAQDERGWLPGLPVSTPGEFPGNGKGAGCRSCPLGLSREPRALACDRCHARRVGRIVQAELLAGFDRWDAGLLVPAKAAIVLGDHLVDPLPGQELVAER